MTDVLSPEAELEERLREHLRQIVPPNQALAAAAARRENDLAKPRGSLGRLESLAIQLCAVQNTSRPRHESRLVVVCAADHGVVEEGVSPYPADVTRQQIENFQAGGGAITTLSRTAGAKVLLLDVGVNYDFAPHPNRLDAKIAKGTKNMAKGPAMTRAEALRSVLAGLELVLAQPPLDLVAAGEMGIGNTTPSSAIASLYVGLTPQQATGVGSGLDPSQVARKAAVVAKALEVNRPDPQDPIDVLAKVGGLEIGAMTGVYLGAAVRRAAAVIDGFIGSAAALLAEKLSPGVKSYFVAGHRSKEKAHAAVLESLGLKPLLDLDMWLGEGSGAVAAMLIIQCAVVHFNEMRTLAEAGVHDTVEAQPD
ncbi:MAG: nicotinate-nucleotide--dimethylbenzimidazole phosphoribosyltransferase [Deltaproteobacteria bacterium]|jgi:nicotinate-nucleotide--dimethylbenzimidazole phosphoribosyltransferase|nr:nicotinate-nucleotide--dimethylbenzimidazole phosphoribosyltransferase [Deltaproteobacteria bacterium]